MTRTLRRLVFLAHVLHAWFVLNWKAQRQVEARMMWRLYDSVYHTHAANTTLVLLWLECRICGCWALRRTRSSFFLTKLSWKQREDAGVWAALHRTVLLWLVECNGPRPRHEMTHATDGQSSPSDGRELHSEYRLAIEGPEAMRTRTGDRNCFNLIRSRCHLSLLALLCITLEHLMEFWWMLNRVAICI